jgi:hypothetical protein
MNIYGFDSIAGLLDNTGYLFKLIVNERGVVLFPHTTEHRDGAQPGIVYADDSRGNALAAMVKPNLIEFRQHRDFSDQRVLNIVGRILELQEFAFARNFSVTYQARVLIELKTTRLESSGRLDLDCGESYSGGCLRTLREQPARLRLGRRVSRRGVLVRVSLPQLNKGNQTQFDPPVMPRATNARVWRRIFITGRSCPQALRGADFHRPPISLGFLVATVR